MPLTTLIHGMVTKPKWLFKWLLFLFICTFVGSSTAGDILITCTADDKTAFVEFQSMHNGFTWEELGNSPLCEFDAEDDGLLVCFRARAVGQTGYASEYTAPVCYVGGCHADE
jgi:hypothetical protein